MSANFKMFYGTPYMFSDSTQNYKTFLFSVIFLINRFAWELQSLKSFKKLDVRCIFSSTEKSPAENASHVSFSKTVAPTISKRAGSTKNKRVL